MTQRSFVRTLALAFAAFLLASCTLMYQRTYMVEPVEKLSAADQRAVFDSFKSYLIDKGLRPLPTGRMDDNNVVSFRVGGGTTGLLTRSPYSDILELRYASTDEFELRLVRIVSHPADFSEQGLAKFVAESEAFIQEASAKKVHLRLVPQ